MRRKMDEKWTTGYWGRRVGSHETKWFKTMKEAKAYVGEQGRWMYNWGKN